MSSSRPGRERSRKRLISSSSRKVPRDAISGSLALCFFLKSSRYSCGSSSRAFRFRGGTRPARLSASEGAGSLETRKKEDCGEPAARRSAAAVAQVVFPTPPLPPKMRSCKPGAARKRGTPASLALLAFPSTAPRFPVSTAGPLSDSLAGLVYPVQPLQQYLLFRGKLLFGQFPRFQPHVERAEFGGD